jgi:hypothetical protein
VHEVGRAEHASTEQLSAMLDAQAAPDEQQFLTGHVVGCVVCSNELADLRSVRNLLRSLPVYLPPRSFAIPVEEVAPPPRPFARLIPFTRVLGTVAAVLCVVLFSVDAMQTGYDAPVSTSSGGAAMQLNPLGTFEVAGASGARGDGRQAAESQPAADTGQAETSSKVTNAPAADRAPFGTQASLAAAPPAVIAGTVTMTPVGALPAAAVGRAADPPAPASAQQAQRGTAAPAQSAPKPAAAQAEGASSSAAAAQPAAPAPASGPTIEAFAPGQPAVAPTVRVALTPTPNASTDQAVATDGLQPPATAPTAASPWSSPIRRWSLALALVAAALLILSMVLSRLSRKRAGPRDEWTGA